MVNDRDPAWPDEDEWGPWNLINHRDSFEERRHETLVLFERRCRHCKTILTEIPPEPCPKETCQAANLIGNYEPVSFRKVR